MAIRSFLREYHSKFIVQRMGILKWILNRVGVKKIRDHWVYIKDLQNKSIVIDLGANRGAFSKEIGALYQCKCYVVEPNEELYDLLIQEKMNALHYAITSTNGPVEFYISTNPEASSLINNFENVWGVDKKVNVQGITFQVLLDKLSIRNKEIEILKIDIEGAELELIESFTKDDVKDIKQITIEFHDWLNKDLHQRTVIAIRKLISLGFTAYTDTPHHGNAVEMLFLNKQLIPLSLSQKLYLSLFKATAFLKYN